LPPKNVFFPQNLKTWLFCFGVYGALQTDKVNVDDPVNEVQAVCKKQKVDPQLPPVTLSLTGL